MSELQPMDQIKDSLLGLMIFCLANGTSWFQVTGTGPTAINKQYFDLGEVCITQH